MTAYDAFTRVTLDGERYYECRLPLDEIGRRDPIRWNGWLMPQFDRENVQRLMDDLKDGPPGTEKLSWDGAVLVMTDPIEDTPTRIEPITVDHGFPAGVKEWWDLGHIGWVWTDMDTEDLTVMGAVTARTEITMEDLKNLSVTACEGGIGYWALMTKGAEKGHATYQTHATFEIVPDSGTETWDEEISDGIGGFPTPIVVNPELLLRGLQLYCDGRWYTNDRIRAKDPRSVLEDLDSSEADVIVQLGCFGKVVYG